MTAVGTSVGMLPIALEWAIGLERLSPLAVVATGGLMVSTFLTLIYVPVLYSLFDGLKETVKRFLPLRKLAQLENDKEYHDQQKGLQKEPLRG
jgi:hypothetical protein